MSPMPACAECSGKRVSNTIRSIARVPSGRPSRRRNEIGVLMPCRSTPRIRR